MYVPESDPVFTMVQGVAEGEPVRTVVDTSWTFSTVNALEPLVIRAGSLPASLHYLPVRDLMVVVDPVVEGLIEVSMTSLLGERSYR
jgi:hypothetical protein